MARWRAVLAALLVAVPVVLGLGGCDPQTMMKAQVPADREATGRTIIEDIRTGNFALVEQRLDPASASAAQVRAVLPTMRDHFPHESPKSIKVVGYNSQTENGVTSNNLTYEYEFSKAWLLAAVNYRDTGSQILVNGVALQPLKDSIEHFNAFRFDGKTPLHFAFLALVVLTALFSLVTFVVCLFTPVPAFKWVWAIAILVGVVQFSFNWTNGAWDWHLFYFQLMSAGFFQGLYGPVILQVAIPVWAILFWVRRGGWMRAERGLDEGDLRAL